MEIAKVELAALNVAVNEPKQQIFELAELELSLIGGGMGDVVFV